MFKDMEDRKYHIDLTNDEVCKIIFAIEQRAKIWDLQEYDAETRACEILYKEYKLLEERMRKLLIIGADNE